jgi:hypothetical protein
MNEQTETQATENAMDQSALDAIAAENESGEDQTEDQQTELMPTSEILYPVMSLITALTMPNWNIGEVENQKLSECYADLLDKYYPNICGSYGVEINALLITGAIFAPRIGTPRIKEEPKEDATIAESAVQETPQDWPVMDSGTVQ